MENISPIYKTISANLEIIDIPMDMANTLSGSLGSRSVALVDSVNIASDGSVYNVVVGGLSTFGDGSDGALVTSGNVTLTADKYYTNLTILAGHTFSPAGYRVFVKGELILNGTIAGNGNNGSNAGGKPGGSGATALADGYLKGSIAGVAGGDGNNGAVGSNSTGTSTSNSIGSNGVAGGTGGAGVFAAGTSTGGTATAPNVSLLVNPQLQTLLDVGATGATIKYNNSASSGGGGGGGGGSASSAGGGGGGSGGAGRIIAIFAKTITINSGGVGNAIGGTGGNGANAPGLNLACGGGGGGAGGNGGQIILVYNSISELGTFSVAGGAGGNGGNGAQDGAAGSAGNSGGAGSIRRFKISL